ncbi:eukaryotic translation elongation factor 1 epsilon-1 [Pectinophora gossypiella]|uniref:eukaryotic translation elongation factor 1 epsilon-1 n=1 Tax=Pectinophora gossypiella TaxID=13191 RepID=UPI00214EEF8C|nr:eukaryotic translation elongation factor 1 epsilon-1 [Pectinophora gossypiella]
MSACTVEVIKLIGKYLNTPVGTVCYNTDKVLTTVLDKQNVEGFASIVLRLAAKSGSPWSQEQALLSYQWLEHIAMYANQAVANPTCSKNFLEDINKALERNTYLAGQFLTVTDVAVYYVLYPLLERLSVIERESLLHLCRWSKHIQAQPKVCASKPPLPLNTLTLSILAPAAH